MATICENCHYTSFKDEPNAKGNCIKRKLFVTRKSTCRDWHPIELTKAHMEEETKLADKPRQFSLNLGTTTGRIKSNAK